jgi:hypothetical protein
MTHLTMEALEAGLAVIRESPPDMGVLDLIVRRPDVDAREVLEQGELDPGAGLVGDNWAARAGGRKSGRVPRPDTQLNVMNSRVIALVAQDRSRWQLAGDQLFLDLDLSTDNLPAGARLAIGTAVIEVSPEPHTGCSKFVSRFGVDAMKFVNSRTGTRLRLRGLNAKVVQAGTIRIGDLATKVR